MLKTKSDRKKKILGKKTCKCGRKVVVKRIDGKMPPFVECSNCKQFGYKESRRQYLELYKCKVAKINIVGEKDDKMQKLL